MSMESKRIDLKGEEILKTLTPLRKRWKLLKGIEKGFMALAILGFAGVFITPIAFIQILDTHKYIPAICIATFLVFIVLSNIMAKVSAKTKKKYADMYKRLISQPVLDACFDNAQYEAEAGYPREDFKASGLLPIGSSYTYDSEDLITGTYKGVAFRRADIRITHRTGGEHKSTVVDADGRLLEVAYHKKINGTVKIVKEAEAIMLFAEDVLVETEDMEFNRIFNVYAKDKHSAFYLLTPQFIEYIKQLSEKEDKLFITFDGEKLYILLSGHGGIFEPPMGEFNIWDEVRKCKAELAEIDEIIDNLRLDVAAEQDKILEEAMENVNEEMLSEPAYQPEPPKRAPGRITNAGGMVLLIVLILLILLPFFFMLVPFILQAIGA